MVLLWVPTFPFTMRPASGFARLAATHFCSGRTTVTLSQVATDQEGAPLQTMRSYLFLSSENRPIWVFFSPWMRCIFAMHHVVFEWRYI
jgi:hypothetical protein